MTAVPIALAYLAPTRLINANHRENYHVRNARTQLWRRASADEASIAPAPAPIPCRIVVVVHRSHDKGRIDPANFAPTAKAIVDGLVDADILIDDSSLYVIGPDIRLGNPWPKAGVEVHLLEPTPGDPPTITDPPAGDPLWS